MPNSESISLAVLPAISITILIPGRYGNHAGIPADDNVMSGSISCVIASLTRGAIMAVHAGQLPAVLLQQCPGAVPARSQPCFDFHAISF